MKADTSRKTSWVLAIITGLFMLCSCNPEQQPAGGDTPKPEQPKPEDPVLRLGTGDKVPVKGGTVELSIDYNVEYAVEVEESAQSWIKFIETKALVSKKLVFEVAANTGAERSGKVTVKDKSGKHAPVSASITQEAFVAVSAVELDLQEIVLEIGKTHTLKVGVKPEDATDKSISWSSDKPEIATVDANGLVSAVAEGSATVTATAGGQSASCKVTVTKAAETIIRGVLMELYQALDGPNWSDNEGWGTAQDIAYWSGVSYVNGELSLNLTKKGLKGELPESFGELGPYLKWLNIEDEPGLTGKIPDSFSKLVNVEFLQIRNTSITSLPDVFGGWTRLQKAFITFNEKLTGPLPESLGTLSQLELLYLFENSFTGSIPSSYAALIREGMILDLSSNCLNGQIPQSILNAKEAKYYMEHILRQKEGYGFDLSNTDIAVWPVKREGIETFTGEVLSMEEVVSKSKYTVDLFWAPWCPFSAHLMPALRDYYQKYRQDGLEVVAAVQVDNARGDGYWDLWTDYAGLEKTVAQNRYDKWYNYHWAKYFDGYFMTVPVAQVYDQKGNVVFSSIYQFPDPVRKRFGKTASSDLIPFLETLFGPADGNGDLHTSTDYSKDGQVLVLQKATKGKGINLVFMGDAYTDKDMGDGGLYEKLMKQCMDEFFAIEPYKTFRDRFNVYAVKAVSKHNRIGDDYSTAFSAYFGKGTYVGGDVDKVLDYALKVPEIKQKDNLVVSVLVSSAKHSGTTFMLESLQSGVAFTSSMGNLAEAFGNTLRHEAGGHGFGFLSDEYHTHNESIPADEKDYYNEVYNKYGWFSNVDFTDDPFKIRWKAFLSDDRYKGEVGIYEGGATYLKGAWRPSLNSMMRHNYEYFNAPSRWAIYKRIMELSGESYSFESFLQYDAVNRASATKAFRAPMRAPEHVHLTPPVILP